jgi:hypothetical protein
MTAPSWEGVSRTEGGLRVLTARGGELGRDMPFGFAHQLLDPTIHELDPADRCVVLGGAALHTHALLGLTTLVRAHSGEPASQRSD